MIGYPKIKSSKKNRVKEWNDIRNKVVKPLFEKKCITSCEIRFSGCLGGNFLTFAHRHKRVWYYSCPNFLGLFDQVILACQNCHQKIEHNREVTKSVFLALRGEESK